MLSNNYQCRYRQKGPSKMGSQESKLYRVLLEEGKQSVPHLLNEHGFKLKEIATPIALNRGIFECTQEDGKVYLDLNIQV